MVAAAWPLDNPKESDTISLHIPGSSLMKAKNWAVLAGILLITLTSAANVRAAAKTAPATTAPAATGPAGFTRHDYLKAVLEFNRRTLSDAYKRAGKHDPKWDEPAAEFFDKMALRMALGGADYFYTLPGAETVTTERMLPLAEQLHSAGCDDPMFLYCYGTLLSDAQRSEEAAPLLAQANTALMASRYPVNRAAYAAIRQYYAAPAGSAQDAAWAKARDAILATISTWEFKDIDRRILFDHLSGLAANVPPERMLELVEAARDLKNADPWLVNMFAGKYHIDAAWQTRGGGTANTVTDAGWQGFFDQLSKARDALTAAWKLHPEYPEAPTLMIPVAMGAGQQLDERTRTWFERATQAQIDYREAYERYRYSLLPRWGGSVPQLQRFADRCVASGRFDTDVPWQFAKTLEAIIADTGQPQMWMSQGVFERVHEMCAGYIKQIGPDKRSDYFRLYEAAGACRAARWPDARKTIESLGERLEDMHAFRRVGLMPQYTISAAFAFTGPDADALVAAEQKAQMHQIDDAIAAYQKAADKVPADKSPDARAAHYLKQRLQHLKWQKEFEKGDWVDVQPKDAELIGWEVIGGKWTVDKDGTLTGVADNDGLLLTFADHYLSPRFEIDGRMELPPPKTPGGSTYFGMSLSVADPAAFSGWWLERHTDKVDVYNTWLRQFHREIPIENDNAVNMTQFDENMIGRLNGHMTSNMVQMFQLTGPEVYLGMGAPGTPLGTEVHLKKLRVRKLTEQPAK